MLAGRGIQALGPVLALPGLRADANVSLQRVWQVHYASQHFAAHAFQATTPAYLCGECIVLMFRSHMPPSLLFSKLYHCMLRG